MMREEAESHAGSFRDFLERGLSVAVLAKKFLCRLKQGGLPGRTLFFCAGYPFDGAVFAAGFFRFP